MKHKFRKFLAVVLGDDCYRHSASSFKSYNRYFACEAGDVDNIKRHHIRLFVECDRCGKHFHIGQIHGTEDGNILHGTWRQKINRATH